MRADHRVNLVDLPDHGRPALGWDGPKLRLDNPERRRVLLPDHPAVGVGIQAKITNHDLAFIWNMRRHPGNELQIIHRLQRVAMPPMPVTDSSRRLQEGQSIQGQERPDHVLAHPLSLYLSLGPNPAMNIEARVGPGDQPLRPRRAENLSADQKQQHLAGKKLSQPRVVSRRRAAGNTASTCSRRPPTSISAR
jgi:hypothetical protein